jgi:hypothetical protein
MNMSKQTHSDKKIERTTIALTRDEFSAIDTARKHFTDSFGVRVSRTSFVASLATKYCKENALEIPKV